MTKRQKTWCLEDLLRLQLGHVVMLVTPSVAGTVAAHLPFQTVDNLDEIPENLDTLIVIGGGTLLDSAKVWRSRHAKAACLIAIPSLWGSGAEVSPVAVLDHDGRKEILMGDDLIPDVRCLWPQLLLTVPDELAHQACGDSWSHALEGFLSPLANEDVQAELADVIKAMLSLPLAVDPGWFEASARACAGQARAGVGLVHGIAHTLEQPLRSGFPASNWGHAKLCSVFLLPVMAFNRVHSPKWDRLATRYELDTQAILNVVKDLHDHEAFEQALDLLDANWMEIVRDPCSRTNSALVRPSSKEFFLERTFS